MATHLTRLPAPGSQDRRLSSDIHSAGNPLMRRPDPPRAIFAHADTSRKARPRLSLRRAHARRRGPRHKGAQRRAAAAECRGAGGSAPPDRCRGLRGFRGANIRREAPSVEATEMHWNLDVGWLRCGRAAGYRHGPKRQKAHEDLDGTRAGQPRDLGATPGGPVDLDRAQEWEILSLPKVGPGARTSHSRRTGTRSARSALSMSCAA